MLTVTIDSIDLPADVKTAAETEIEKIIEDVKRLVLAGLGVTEDEITDTDEIADLDASIAAETRARYYIRGTPTEYTATRYGDKFYSQDAHTLYAKWWDPFIPIEYTNGTNSL